MVDVATKHKTPTRTEHGSQNQYDGGQRKRAEHNLAESRRDRHDGGRVYGSGGCLLMLLMLWSATDASS